MTDTVMATPATMNASRPARLAALFGVILAGILIWLAASLFAGQAGRHTAQAEARAVATMAADETGKAMESAVAIAPGEALDRLSDEFARLEGPQISSATLVDTRARTIASVYPETRAATPMTDRSKPQFDAALAVRSAMPAQGLGPARGFVAADGKGVGVQGFRTAGPDPTAPLPAGMIEVRVTPKDGGGLSLTALGLILAPLVVSLGLILVMPGTSLARSGVVGGAVVSGIVATWAAWQGTNSHAANALADLTELAGAIGATAPALVHVGDATAAAISTGLASAFAVLLAWAFASGAMGRLWDTIVAHRTAYAYIAPAIILLILLSFFPFFYGIAMSFTDTTLLNQSAPFTERFNGLDNYAAILGDFNLRQPETGVLNYQNFYWTAFMTLIWTVSNVFLGVTIGLGLALLLNIKGLKGVAIYRTLLILPWALPNYITALTWKGLFHPQFGAFNSLIQAFGGEPVKWFDTLWPAFITGLATNAWLSFPFMMVVALGALQSIDQDMYEAAKIDGASPWQRFTMITLPSLRPALLPAIIVSVVWTFNMFNVIFLVSAGQPSGGTEILITRAYKVAFEEYRYGYAAAYSVVIFLILLIYGVFQVRATRATEANA